MNGLLSRKFLMGLVAEAGIVVCALIGRTDMAVYAIYALGAVALVSVGGQSVVDAFRAWSEGKPFVLDQAKGPGVEPDVPWGRPLITPAPPPPKDRPLSTMPSPSLPDVRHP